MKVNKTLVKKWIHALESDKYTQGKSRMRTEEPSGSNSYCCLGVLCDVVDPSKWNKLPTGRYYWNHSSFAVPPKSVLHSVGLRDTGETIEGQYVWEFIEVNDGVGEFSAENLGPLTFRNIAEALRMEHDIWD